MAIIDLHCHIDLYKDPGAVLARADAAGIYVLSVTTTPSAWPGTNQMSKNNKRTRTALGLHPQLAHKRSGELPLFERLLSEVQYVGEIGLDGSRHFKKHHEIQLKVFSKMVAMVNDHGGRIMSIHSKQAVNEVLDVLIKYPNAGPVILHWFSGTKTQLRKAINLGCWFSVGPKMLQSVKGKELVSHIPLNRVLLETDGPFAKDRYGKPYEPIDTLSMIRGLSQQRKELESDVECAVLNNFRELVSFNSKHKSPDSKAGVMTRSDR